MLMGLLLIEDARPSLEDVQFDPKALVLFRSVQSNAKIPNLTSKLFNLRAFTTLHLYSYQYLIHQTYTSDYIKDTRFVASSKGLGIATALAAIALYFDFFVRFIFAYGRMGAQ